MSERDRLREGDQAPDFTLPGTDRDGAPEEIRNFSLREATRDGPAIVTFYLFDFNPTCSDHLCGLRDAGWFDLLPETSVLAISTDRTFSHRAFADHHELNFPLLSDSDGGVSEEHGVIYDEFKRHRRIAKRAVFVVDQARTVQYAWATDDPQQLPNWAAVLETFKANPSLPGPQGREVP